MAFILETQSPLYVGNWASSRKSSYQCPPRKSSWLWKLCGLVTQNILLEALTILIPCLHHTPAQALDPYTLMEMSDDVERCRNCLPLTLYHTASQQSHNKAVARSPDWEFSFQPKYSIFCDLLPWEAPVGLCAGLPIISVYVFSPDV